MCIDSLFKRFWDWIKSSEFFTAFCATLFGVLLAFVLQDMWQHHQLNRATAQYLQLAYLESEYNIVIAQNILDKFSGPIADKVDFKRTSHSAADLVIHDENVLSLLAAERLSLLSAYVVALNVLNESLDAHREYLFSSGVRPLPAGDKLVQTIRSNAAEAFAACIVVQGQFESYNDRRIFDRDILDKLENKIDEEKQKALMGQTAVSKKIE
jgi:hypothetical protein